jgi:hypothetical protein
MSFEICFPNTLIKIKIKMLIVIEQLKSFYRIELGGSMEVFLFLIMYLHI